MKNFDPLVFYYVFHEMLGMLLPLLALLAVGGVLAFIAVLRHDGGLISRRLVVSEGVGVLGGFAALALMAAVTLSGFSDAGGPVDWLLIGIIWGAGMVGTTILAYTVQGFIRWRR